VACSSVRGCPTADRGGEGAVGTFQPSVVVAWVAGSQALVCSVVMGNSGVVVSLVKVQPSLVLTVAAVGILLVLGDRFPCVFLMELSNEIAGVFKVLGGILGAVGVVKPSPLDSILDLDPLAAGVEDLFYFPLLLFLDDDWRWARSILLC